MWRKSSYSGADGCVQVRRVDAMILDQEWRKATKSNNNGACAQVRADGQGGVQVRDSKLGEASPILGFTAAEWDAFQDGVIDGEFRLK